MDGKVTTNVRLLFTGALFMEFSLYSFSPATVTFLSGSHRPDL